MTSPDLLRELRKVYAEELATQWAKAATQRTDLAMLAVYERGRRDGATQQRNSDLSQEPGTAQDDYPLVTDAESKETK